MDHLLSKGYCKLELGSYHVWVLKDWHEFFVTNGFVRQDRLGKFIPSIKYHKDGYKDKIDAEAFKTFNQVMYLYDIYLDAIENNKLLLPEQMTQISNMGLIPTKTND